MISVAIVSPRLLSEDDVSAMLTLHRGYFAGVRETAFRSDLEEKDWVILLRRTDGALVGFSTQKLLEIPAESGPLPVLFSGDTIVDRRHRLQAGLAGGFGHLMLRLIERHGARALYWFLITKGFRTYRFLPVFFHSYFPGLERTEEQARRYRPLLDRVAGHRYGRAYDPATGCIRPPGGGDRLREEWADLDARRLTDPHADFFARANPGWRRGDELACLAPISRENLKPGAWRVIRSTAPEWIE